MNSLRSTLLNPYSPTVPDLLGSRAGIIQRPSLLDPDVKLSPHPAPDSIRQCLLLSCVGNRGNSHVRLPDY